MKNYSIYYYFDKENFVVRSIDVKDGYDTETILREYTKGDHQIFSEGPGSLTRVNMNNISYTKIYEID